MNPYLIYGIVGTGQQVKATNQSTGDTQTISPSTDNFYIVDCANFSSQYSNNDIILLEVTGYNSQTVTIDTANYPDGRQVNFQIGVVSGLPYGDIGEVYQKAGLGASDVSPSDVNINIRDADAWIDELHGKSWKNATSMTEWIDTYDEDENVETIEAPEINRIFLSKTPIQSITSLEEYDTSNTLVETYTASDYWYDANTGALSLIDGTFGNQRHRVKAVYAYGYTTVPTNIRRLSNVVAAIATVRNKLAKSWERPASVAVPNVSHSVGVITNLLDIIRQLEAEKKELVDTIGRRKLGFAAI